MDHRRYPKEKVIIDAQGAIIKGDTSAAKIALVFTGDEFADGGTVIQTALRRQKCKASFFFTGRFYRNPEFGSLVKRLKANGHYLGSHSDAHLLYCDWKKRDSLLVSKEQFIADLNKSFATMDSLGIDKIRPFIIYLPMNGIIKL